jgi:hypothetical protein
MTRHEGPEVEETYIFTLSLTSALDGVGGQCHAPAALTPGKDPVPILQEAGCASQPVCTCIYSITSIIRASINREFD